MDALHDRAERLAEAEQARYLDRAPTSRAAFEDAGRVLPGGVSRGTMAYQPYPFYASHGAGARLYDLDGNEYLDLVNNHTSLIHGHGHAPTNAAAQSALQSGQAIGTPTLDELALADELRRRIPALEVMRFASTGSEAVQYAIRVARVATGRQRVLKFEGAFHGSEAAVLQDIWNTEPMPPGTARRSRPSSAGLSEVTTVTAVYNDPAAVASAFEQWGDEIAVVVVEPFLGNAALVRPGETFLEAVFEQAHSHGALVLFDEIQGLRASYGGAEQVFDVNPDLVAVGKIISGGFALAGYGGRRELMYHLTDPAAPMPQTGTFTASPVALRAGLAALPAFDEAQYDRLSRLREQFADRATDEFSRRGIPVQVNGMGSLFHLSINGRPVDSYAAHLASDHATWAAVRLGLLNRGIYMMPRGTGCLTTPMTEADIEVFGGALEDVLSEL